MKVVQDGHRGYPPPSLSHRVPSTAAPEATSLPPPLPPYCFSVLFNLSSVSLRLIAFAAFLFRDVFCFTFCPHTPFFISNTSCPPSRALSYATPFLTSPKPSRPFFFFFFSLLALTHLSKTQPFYSSHDNGADDGGGASL